MIKDINDPSIGAVVSTDICIIGAGAAGITLAHKFINSGLNVLILESGGFNREAGTDALNNLTVNENIDANIEGVKNNRGDSCRQRFFGGTTNHWSGWCRPLDPIDFKQRHWVPGSGWPITLDELTAYYKEAEGYCDLDSPLFHLAQMSSGADKMPKYNVDKIESVFWTLSPPTRFGPKYQADLTSAQNVSVLLHANVVEVITGESEASVSSLRVRSLNGKEVTVAAKKYILACGALENARLLLSSNKRNPSGIGNQSGMLGKNYQNHPHVHAATIQATDPEGLTELYKRTHTESGNRLRVGIAAGEAAQEQSEILNFGATIPLLGADKMDIFSKMKRAILSLTGSADDAEHEVYMYTEQAPNTLSRVVLTNEKDAVGMPRMRMDWQLNELDKHTVQVGTQLIAEEFGRLNLGRIRVNDWVTKDRTTWSSIWGGCHHIGTTRMSAKAEDGVVDGNCKVHGIDNLYIAGSSVFPTGGHAPPTFTIVALALRLADHLSS